MQRMTSTQKIGTEFEAISLSAIMIPNMFILPAPGLSTYLQYIMSFVLYISIIIIVNYNCQMV